jgi:type I restriction-modification system DNA methylase subunit
LTNFVDFQLYRNGELISEARLSFDNPKYNNAVIELLQDFITYNQITIKSTSLLAEYLARRARQLRYVLEKTVAHDIEKKQDTDLVVLYKGLREALVSDLTVEYFADLYAQTITYGLFAARCQAALTNQKTQFTRFDAINLIPGTNPFLKKLFRFIVLQDLDTAIAWIIDDIAQVLNNVDIDVMLKDFVAKINEDPVVYFYEDFLKNYDAETRKNRGVYYTPVPVVSFMVRAVDHILKTHFDKTLGIADPSALILDPSCGTGSFLYEIINQVYNSVKNDIGEGAWQDYVQNKLINRIFGFEILLAPYIIAHIKMSLQLQQLGYKFHQNDRLGIYLTNTLDEAVSKDDILFADFITKESNEAVKIKREKPILIVLGNPPYNIFSLNRHEKEIEVIQNGRKVRKKVPTFIGRLIQDYKYIENKKIDLMSGGSLYDDYVKFIR